MSQLRIMAAIVAALAMLSACAGGESGDSSGTHDPLNDDDCRALGLSGLPAVCELRMSPPLDPAVCEQREQALMAQKSAMSDVCPEVLEPTPTPTATPQCDVDRCELEFRPRNCAVDAERGDVIKQQVNCACDPRFDACACDEIVVEDCPHGCRIGAPECNDGPQPTSPVCPTDPPDGASYVCGGGGDPLTVRYVVNEWFCTFTMFLPDGTQAGLGGEDSRLALLEDISSGYCVRQ